MTSKRTTEGGTAAISEKGKGRARQPSPRPIANLHALSPDRIQRLLHELEVHQIELEMQNDELCRAQQELEASRARYRVLYDMAPVGYCSLDGQGAIREANQTVMQMLQTGRDAMVGRRFALFVAEEGRQRFQGLLARILETGLPQTSEVRMARSDGTLFWARLQANRACGSDDTSVCRVAISDISEQKRAEEALLASELRYRRLFETAQDGIVILDADTERIADANPFLAAMLGYSWSDLQGKPLSALGAEADRDRWKAAFTTLRRTGYVRSKRLRLLTIERRPVDVEFVGSRYRVNDQDLIQCNIRDVTERKRVVAKLQKVRDELEGRVERRTRALQQDLSEIRTIKDQLEAENSYLREQSGMKHRFEHILGQSDGLKYVLYRAEQVAPADTTVLILGETGTGKELVAAAIHNLSPRRERPLITVNCAALPGNLIESELFGREKGAFTGADSRQIGRFEIAHGSTLCLDEIGELPLDVQAKLLRAIQHNEFERLGSSRTIKVDVRIIATTNRNLEEEVGRGRFRQDLFYRLNVFPITVPPLRQRREDIPLMARSFLERYARKLGKPVRSLHREALKTLQDYAWPGNVRELESVIERAVILSNGPVLQLIEKLGPAAPVSLGSSRTLEEAQRIQILRILSETRWRIEGRQGAAEILGLHPSTLRARMHKLGIARLGSRQAE